MGELENKDYNFDSFSPSEIIKKHPELSYFLESLESPIEKMKKEERKLEAFKDEIRQHVRGERGFVNSFSGNNVNPIIMGEWNVIKKEIDDFLFHKTYTEMDFQGGCPYMIEFYNQEVIHLNSIKSKLGINAIEYQIICSLVTEAIILKIEGCLISQKYRYSDGSYSTELKHRMYDENFLQDTLFVLDKTSSLNMEYEYKYERFNPFYKVLSDKAERVGVKKKEIKSSKFGCLSIIVLAFVSTLLFSKFLL